MSRTTDVVILTGRTVHPYKTRPAPGEQERESGVAQRRSRMQSWYSSMASEQRRTFWACFLGWVLDAMDVQLFAFVIPTLLTLWGMTKAEAGVLGTSALISSAIAGRLAVLPPGPLAT